MSLIHTSYRANTRIGTRMRQHISLIHTSYSRDLTARDRAPSRHEIAPFTSGTARSRRGRLVPVSLLAGSALAPVSTAMSLSRMPMSSEEKPCRRRSCRRGTPQMTSSAHSKEQVCDAEEVSAVGLVAVELRATGTHIQVRQVAQCTRHLFPGQWARERVPERHKQPLAALRSALTLSTIDLWPWQMSFVCVRTQYLLEHASGAHQPASDWARSGQAHPQDRDERACAYRELAHFKGCRASGRRARTRELAACSNALGVRRF